MSALWVANLRIEQRPRRQQLARAGHVGEVGHRLAREHRIVGKAALLGALDLGVPVGALDQAHHQPAAQRLRSAGRPSRSPRARASGRPAPRGRGRPSRRATGSARTRPMMSSDSSSRSASSASMVKLQVVRLGRARELEQRAASAPPAPARANRLVARMQRRQLHRNAGPLRQAAPPALRADRGDRLA